MVLFAFKQPADSFLNLLKHANMAQMFTEISTFESRSISPSDSNDPCFREKKTAYFFIINLALNCIWNILIQIIKKNSLYLSWCYYL